MSSLPLSGDSMLRLSTVKTPIPGDLSEREATDVERRLMALEMLAGDDEITEEKVDALVDAMDGEVDGAPMVSIAAAFAFVNMVKNGKGFLKSIAEVVGTRIGLARIARSLDLPDHAIFFLQKAYADIKLGLDYILDLFKWEDIESGLQIPPALKEAIETLKFLKDQVVTELKLTLGGIGVHVSREEMEAMMSEDEDFDEDMPAAKKEVLQRFHNGMTAEKRKELVASGGNKLLQALPELIGRAAEILVGLTEDDSVSTGPALMGVNAALTKLEGAKALIRIFGNGKNSLLGEFAKEAARFQPQVFELENMANRVFKAIADRTAQRIRLPIDDNKDKLGQLMEQQKPDEIRLLRNDRLRRRGEALQGVELERQSVQVLKQSVLQLGQQAAATGGGGTQSRRVANG